jgi:hypothetical protein
MDIKIDYELNLNKKTLNLCLVIPESSEPKLVKSSRFLLSLSLLDGAFAVATVDFLTTLTQFEFDTSSLSATKVAVDDDIGNGVFTSISSDGGVSEAKKHGLFT